MSINFHCRSCAGDQGINILDLGMQPLANNFLAPGDINKQEPKFPLDLAVCKTCWLMQITALVPPVELFSEYLYFSSFSDTMLRHAREAVSRYIKEFSLGRDSFAIEIASNDGYLLQNFLSAGIPCLGVEPAANIARVAQEKGIDTIVEFFGESCAKTLAAKKRKADLILGNNVFAHAPDTNDFVAGLKYLLNPQGRIVLESAYGVDMVDHVEFDTIYHEHVFYFSLTSLIPLFKRHGLEIFRAEHLSIHGGSLRFFAAHAGDFPVEDSVREILEEEERRGIASLEYYGKFAQRVTTLKKSLYDLLAGLKQEGKSIAAYGASAKGTTLLNYVGIGNDILDFVADRSTYKQGLITPGTHIPVVAADQLAARKPDYALLLTWNFADEILKQQEEYRRHGGRFIIPVPEVKIV
ncbi:MAG: class I SAM-dependent methyltransferase [Chthoniobacteraceae bacterium]